MTNLSSLALITPFPSFKGGLISKGISIKSSVKLPINCSPTWPSQQTACLEAKKNQMAKLVKSHSVDLIEDLKVIKFQNVLWVS